MKKKALKEKINKLEKFVKSAGGTVKFSELLDVHYTCVSKWLYAEIPVPIKQAIKIESLTHGEIKASELRPDVFNT